MMLRSTLPGRTKIELGILAINLLPNAGIEPTRQSLHRLFCPLLSAAVAAYCRTGLDPRQQKEFDDIVTKGIYLFTETYAGPDDWKEFKMTKVEDRHSGLISIHRKLHRACFEELRLLGAPPVEVFVLGKANDIRHATIERLMSRTRQRKGGYERGIILAGFVPTWIACWLLSSSIVFWVDSK